MVEAAQRAGWYPDPDGAHGERWFNGVGWSDTRRGIPTAPPAAPVAALPPRTIYSAENPAPQAPGERTVVPVTAALTINSRVNPQAMYGFVAGIFALVFNFLLVPGILAIVFSVQGLRKAKQLESAGQPQTLKALSLIGLILGLVGSTIAVIQFALFVIGFVGTITTSYSP